MPLIKCIYWKILFFTTLGVLSGFLFFVSFHTNYESLLTQEHVRFRRGFPSQSNWILSPIGKLKCYLFNVTNSEEFLKGIDYKLKLEEIGPITYSVIGKNEVLNQSEKNITFQKNRYHKVQFDAKYSCDPNILNKTIILPNFVLLSAAAKLHDWVYIVRRAFNAITINEPIFINQTVNYFLWDFTTPALNMLSKYIPNIVSNCGMLHNALHRKEEIYNARIGTYDDIENFFRLNTLNNNEYFPEQSDRLQFLENPNLDIYCPIKIRGSFDNSLFPPVISTDSDITIVAPESCRTHRLKHNSTLKYMGLDTYKYLLDDVREFPNCLDNTMGIPLHRGFFDVSKCMFNDVPSAFSAPHFLDTTYNWTNHFVGLSPNTNLHETFIIIEPKTGIPLEERYRFQSNIPLPDMKGYNKDLQRFSEMIIPTFWFEFDLDDLPSIVLHLIKLKTSYMQVIQPILMSGLVVTSGLCFLKMYILLK